MDDDQKSSTIEARLDAIEAFSALIAILTDEQRFAAEVASFRTREAAAKQAETAIAEQRRRIDDHALAKRSSLENEAAALIKRVVAAEKEDELHQAAFARQKALVKAWTNFGEADDVTSGLVSSRRPALSKARKAHGIKDDWQEDPSVPWEKVSPSVPGMFPNRTRQAGRPSRRAS